VRARQLAQPTDWDGEADCRGLQAEKPGGSEQKRGEVRWDGRNRAGWHGPNLERLGRGGKTHSEPEDGRDGHMRSRAIKFAVTSSRTFEEPNDTLPLILHLVLVLPWSGEERAAPWSRFGGGLEGRPRRERARLRGPSPHLVDGASRGMVGIGRDGMGRTWRGSAGAGRHTASWRMVEMGTCGRGQSNSRSPRAGPSKNPTTHSPLYCTSLSLSLGQGQSRNAGLAASELGDGALLPYSHPHCTSLSFSPGQGQNGQPPGPASGGGWKAGLAASELGYEAPLPTWVRFGSVRFG